MGGDGLRGLELGRLLAADQAAGDQRRPRRPPRPQTARSTSARSRPTTRAAVALLEAAAQAGLPTSRFNEGHTVTNGAGWFQINSSADNTRMSSSHAYLHPIIGTRPNLEIRTGCWVKPRRRSRTAARRAVEYLTPDLLTHGVGQGAARGDPQRRRDRHAEAADAVGRRPGRAPAGVRDRDARRLARRRRRTSTTTSRGSSSGTPRSRWSARSTQWWEIGLFSTSEEGLDRPDLMMHYGSVPFDMNTARWGYPTTENGFCLTPNVCRGRSRGTVRLRSPRLPRPRARRPALLHRPRGPRRARDGVRDAAGAEDRLAAGDGRVGRRRAGARSRRADRRRADRLHAQDPQHGLPPGLHGAHGPGLRSARGRRPAAARPRGARACGSPTARSCRSCPRSTRASRR